MDHGGMKFGAFIGPHHRLGDNPTLALRRDIELIEWMDHLCFDEAWIGEHHSGGWEIVSSPEVIIAAAAERTRHIKLGSGVVSLPYHHPLQVANRYILLDHVTRGRVILGVGPGALPSDAYMMGIEVTRQRKMMDEALDAIIQLLDGKQPVTMKTGWFELRDARVHLAPYSYPRLPLAAASTTTPSGVIAAGKHGIGVLALGAGLPGGPQGLAKQWAIAEQTAAEHGRKMDRKDFRVVVHLHVAESDAQARKEIERGEAEESYYFTNVLHRTKSTADDPLGAAIASGSYLIGSPDTVAAGIRRLQEWSGGFGTLLVRMHDWAEREAVFRSYELLARYVMPQFQRALPSLQASHDWCREGKKIFEPNVTAVKNAFVDAGQAPPDKIRTFGG